ncbi:MAG: Zn-ribbon domain-containing OB-fold protein [Pseudomonadales bacterium]
MTGRIEPTPTPLSEPYWAGCRAGELRLQHCEGCRRHQFYPRLMCSHCGSRDLSWQQASGRGTVASFTVVRRGVSAAYPAPYVVALIDLPEGVRMMSTLVDVDPESVRIGDPVQVAFESVNEVIALPVFRPASASTAAPPS